MCGQRFVSEEVDGIRQRLSRTTHTHTHNTHPHTNTHKRMHANIKTHAHSLSLFSFLVRRWHKSIRIQDPSSSLNAAARRGDDAAVATLFPGAGQDSEDADDAVSQRRRSRPALLDAALGGHVSTICLLVELSVRKAQRLERHTSSSSSSSSSDEEADANDNEGYEEIGSTCRRTDNNDQPRLGHIQRRTSARKATPPDADAMATGTATALRWRVLEETVDAEGWNFAHYLAYIGQVHKIARVLERLFSWQQLRCRSV